MPMENRIARRAKSHHSKGLSVMPTDQIDGPPFTLPHLPGPYFLLAQLSPPPELSIAISTAVS